MTLIDRLTWDIDYWDQIDGYKSNYMLEFKFVVICV